MISSKSISLEYSIDALNLGDFGAVDALASKNKKELGFFPKDAISEYLSKNGVIGAKSGSGELLGYIMFARYTDRIRVAQVCVDESARGQGLARRLIDALKATATTEKIIKLKCRRDYPAHAFWANVGFVAFDEQAGRSADGHPLTFYGLVLDSSDELDLWKAEISESIQHCVIDAQIFFDFYESPSDKSEPSKNLLNDFLADSLSLWIVDELLSEIGRCEDEQRRNKSRKRAQGFQRINYRRNLADAFENNLKEILPFDTPNKLSDIRQLAKAAASDATVFVTRDRRILGLQDELHRRTGLTIQTPHELIISIYRRDNPTSYSPSYISGLSLCWRKISELNLANIPLDRFLLEGESLGKFKEQLHQRLAQPEDYCCEVLESSREFVALRTTQRKNHDSRSVIEANLCRIVRSSKESLFSSFLLADSVEYALRHSCDYVAFSALQSSPCISLAAQKLGFILNDQQWLKPILSTATSRTEALSRIETLIGLNLSSRSSDYLENLASPLVIDENIPTLLVPIKPNYARQMIDREEAGNQLFVENSSVLLRTNNVYYKKKSSHKMIQAPARILWYVSGKNARIIGISRLTEVEIGKATNLFKKHSQFGVLDWKDVASLTGESLSNDIMALRFSQTHSFRRPILRDALLHICKAENFKLALPGSTNIPYSALQQLYKLGF